MTYNPAALDPMTGRNGPDFNTLLAIFDGPLDLDPKTLGLKPGLARSWTWRDPKTLVLTFPFQTNPVVAQPKVKGVTVDLTNKPRFHSAWIAA